MKPTALRVLYIILLAAAVQVAAAGATYKWVDAQGVVHYSDTPQPGAQQIALPGAQTYHSTPAAATPSASAPVAPAGDGQVYQSCAITQPASQQTLFSPESVHVSVALSPALHPGDALAVTMDGAPLPPIVQGSPEYQITDIDRGTHTLNAVVRNGAGKIVCTGSPVTFFVQRPSVANPQAQVHPH